ncbi:folate transporter [Streptococcus azizii]|uniref:Folate transporter n=1 Tax=Streptococcus azizii TaxID=1579424 RepID=A0AB36JRZ0_9STRE|nr:MULTISPECIES: folate family ECF transporter S component [Streptococcus]MBF0776613.1 folate family ECF transporter S component [Streptococcus sp. 19428wD3_AN2]ONK26176.1 folate transporter [Streptococcus azizii]ONK26676.1 folate transporter [Streptococcus azizii]ONK27587.1 folate transporter [Streptococcus azizii]TFU82709.1 folate family ECF transporter S component [Streptococcus sp. AN2]
MFSKKSPKFGIRLLVVLAMLIAIRYILGQYYSFWIIPNTLKVSLSFIANTLIGMLAGPWIAVIVFVVNDVLTALNSGYPFIIWFTLLEAVQGFLYGYFYYGKKLDIHRKKDWLHVLWATVVIMGIGTFFLTPLLNQIYQQIPIAVQFFVQGRIFKVLEIPFRVVVTMLLLPQLHRIPEVRKLMGIQK